MKIPLIIRRKRTEMLCKIADLIVEVPEIGPLPELCAKYRSDEMLSEKVDKDSSLVFDIETADIIIDGNIKTDVYPELNADSNIYMLSGYSFYRQLINFNGFLLHASAVVKDGKAYLFSGPSGIGKSTHTKLWEKTFGDSAVVINDDKPAIRCIDGKWFAYGTPWCGKDRINQNVKAELAGICFLHRGDRMIKKLLPIEALPQLLKQSNGRENAAQAAIYIKTVNLLIKEIPIFEFYNHADIDDALVTYNAINECEG